MCPVRRITYVSGRSLKEIKRIKRSFGTVFCFPPRRRNPGKQEGSSRKRKAAGFRPLSAWGVFRKPGLRCRMRKDDARELDHATLEALRERAVQRVQEGESPEVVVRILGGGRTAI